MRIARRISLLFASLIVALGTVGATTGTAFAAGPGYNTYPVLDTVLPNGDQQNLYNTVERYGMCFGEDGTYLPDQTCTDGYDGLFAATDGWEYNCYQPDCGQIVVTDKGVSADKRSDFTFLGGYYSYEHIDGNTGQDFFISGSWTNRNQVLPLTKVITVDGVSYTLQLTDVSAYYYRDGMPLETYPACNDTTNLCRGGIA